MMIDNNKKSNLHNEWNMRIIVTYFTNGIKRIFNKNLGRVIAIIYLAVGFLIWHFRYVIWKPDSTLMNVHKLFISFFVLTTILLVTVIVILIIGMPFEAIGISKNLHRIGLVNSAGEAPLLLSKDKGNGKIMIYKFKTLGIPLSDWEDKQSKIESALNIHIDEISEGNNCRIIIVKCVGGENQLHSYIEWSEDMISNENFEIVLGEGYLGKVTVNIAKIPHMLIGGSTGSGKSVLLKLVLMQCIKKGAEVYIADFKGGVDFPPV